MKNKNIHTNRKLYNEAHPENAPLTIASLYPYLRDNFHWEDARDFLTGSADIPVYDEKHVHQIGTLVFIPNNNKGVE